MQNRQLIIESLRLANDLYEMLADEPGVTERYVRLRRLYDAANRRWRRRHFRLDPVSHQPAGSFRQRRGWTR